MDRVYYLSLIEGRHINIWFKKDSCILHIVQNLKRKSIPDYWHAIFVIKKVYLDLFFFLISTLVSYWTTEHVWVAKNNATCFKFIFKEQTFPSVKAALGIYIDIKVWISRSVQSSQTLTSIIITICVSAAQWSKVESGKTNCHQATNSRKCTAGRLQQCC